MPGIVPLRQPPLPAHPVIKDGIVKRNIRKSTQPATRDLPRRPHSSLDPVWINAIHQSTLPKSDCHRGLPAYDSIRIAHLSPEHSARSRLDPDTLPNPSFASIAPVRPSLADVEMDLEEIARYDKLVQDDFLPVAGRTFIADGEFPSVLESFSPDPKYVQDATSSPVGPVTPFGEYVDRAVNAVANQVGVGFDFPEHTGPHEPFSSGLTLDPVYVPPSGLYAPILPPPIAVHGHAPTPQTELLSNLDASNVCRKLADPMAHWVADFVWRACMTGHGLRASSSSESPLLGSGLLATSTPQSLSESVRSVLLSTLLQPSAVFLALWYIVRLPVYFGAMAVVGSEAIFRDELFRGDSSTDIQAFAAFRLCILGFMLANKWLDDHTFSNKTWHTISHVSIQSLNKLELLAVDMFQHDLSVDPLSWAQWLDHLRVHHSSLLPAGVNGSCTPSYPQPISRPSATPHAIIRKTLEDIIEASRTARSLVASGLSQPVYLGLQDRTRETQSGDSTMDAVDLDEDGPLRDEYLPRRRPVMSRNAPGPLLAATEHGCEAEVLFPHEREHLPPPAKWSPEADEPISRERDRSISRYVAVQPAIGFQSTMYRTPYGMAYVDAPRLPESRNWYESREPHCVTGHARSHSQHCGPDRNAVSGQIRPRSYTGVEYTMHPELFAGLPPVISSTGWAPFATFVLPYTHGPMLPMSWLRT